MKKYLSIFLAVLTLMSGMLLTACKDSTDIADYDIDKYITLPEYKGVKIKETVIAVTEDDIDDAVDDLLDEHAETVTLEVTDTVENGDTLKITYQGFIDGEYEAFENGEMFTEQKSAYSLVIGSGSFIPGFEEALVGAHPTETVEFNVTFPEEYKNNPDLENVNTKFVVKIVSAERNIKPEYNDAFVAENTDYETIEEYEAYLAEELRRQADDEELVAEIQDVWKYIVDNTKIIKYPEAVVEAQMQLTIDSYTEYAEAYNMTLEDLLKNYYGTDYDTFLSEIEEECKTYIVEEMILTRIAQLEEITISDVEYAEGADQYAIENGFKDAAALEEYYGEETIRDSLLWDKILTFLVEKADVQPADETKDTSAE